MLWKFRWSRGLAHSWISSWCLKSMLPSLAKRPHAWHCLCSTAALACWAGYQQGHSRGPEMWELFTTHWWSAAGQWRKATLRAWKRVLTADSKTRNSKRRSMRPRKVTPFTSQVRRPGPVGKRTRLVSRLHISWKDSNSRASGRRMWRSCHGSAGAVQFLFPTSYKALCRYLRAQRGSPAPSPAAQGQNGSATAQSHARECARVLLTALGWASLELNTCLFSNGPSANGFWNLRYIQVAVSFCLSLVHL